MINPGRETIKLWLNEANKTHFCGRSLAQSLYVFPVDIWLEGPLGAGKTTFVQGLADGLGAGQITSPTYALEQRYETESGRPFIHMDLYRLNKRAAEAAASSDDHEGIRAIEWPDRLGAKPEHPLIRIALEEKGDGRSLSVSFEDIAIPTRGEIEQWRKDMRLPGHIISHCDAVAAFATECADHLIAEGTLVRREVLESAALLHDLLRFVDFKEQAAPSGFKPSAEHSARWDTIRSEFGGMTHEEACTQFLRQKGYPAIGHIVKTHGLNIAPSERHTIEQTILYYADKRVVGNSVVSLEERFHDFRHRYGKGEETPQQKKWKEEAMEAESELFPDGAPL